MPPQDSSAITGEKTHLINQLSLEDNEQLTNGTQTRFRTKSWIVGATVASVALLGFVRYFSSVGTAPTGPYRLVELQVGEKFFDFYEFYDGADSLGSAGYNTYVGEKRATDLGLINVTYDDTKHTGRVFIQTAAGKNGTFHESVRLEGRRRFDRGLFILDVEHMPSGCGVWPAFWLTDEDKWPANGEIDILEGINTQSVAKTALHTSRECSMYAHVPAYAKTGHWDYATAIPDTFTGELNTFNRIEADNCWIMAPHQWANQGCVAVSSDNDTIGEQMNKLGGGVYVLEWDPVGGYIKSWVFKRESIPENLQASMDTAAENEAVRPDPEEWPLPYAYFAIGDSTGCSTEHFRNMRVVLNTAFCGTVAGNRFFKDCPALSKSFNMKNDSVLTCNAYIAHDPGALMEAYWKINGIYIYERELKKNGQT